MASSFTTWIRLQRLMYGNLRAMQEEFAQAENFITEDTEFHRGNATEEHQDQHAMGA
jgi:hypothetical protein